MGSHSDVVGIKEPVSCSLIDALHNFSKSVFGAREIDAVDLEKLKDDKNFPMIFFLANITIERLLEDIRDQVPSQCPIIKEYKRNEDDKGKINRKK